MSEEDLMAAGMAQTVGMAGSEGQALEVGGADDDSRLDGEGSAGVEVEAQVENTGEGAPAAADEIQVHQELRARLVRQFEGWLDRMLEGEEPPEGLPPEIVSAVRDARNEPPSADAMEGDLYQVFSSLTALTGEIRLQGRAFKQLSDALTPLQDVPSRLDQLRSAAGAGRRGIGKTAGSGASRGQQNWRFAKWKRSTRGVV